jgi:tetratricopeptide (TPR) repeat protein
MSAGQLFDLIMPAAFALSALLSTWVFASARRRFQLLYALALAIGTLFLPLIVLPVYLATMLWRKKTGPPPKWRYTLPLLYAAVSLAAIGVFFYLDTRSVDAHLSRATQAKLVDDTNTAIREYRKALAVEDDPHTHKLLAIELANAGHIEEAVSEFRIAQQGGEPDDSIHYRLGLLFERLNQADQARLEFQKFLTTQTCLQADQRCESTLQRLKNDRWQ